MKSLFLREGKSKPGANEPPKAAKEHATTEYAQVPSRYKFKHNAFHIWKVCVIGNADCHIHTRLATPSSMYEFVF